MGNFYESPRWSAEVPDCSMPMTFDQYSNCSYRCLYCFSTYQRGVGRGKARYFAKTVKPVNIEKVKRIFTDIDNGRNMFATYIKRRMVMQWGGLSDPFCNFEREHGIGLELLRFFRDIDYPLCLSTKGVWWLDDPRYTELFQDNPSWNVKVSIITLDSNGHSKIEVGTPTPWERLDAIAKIAKLNCGGATLRFRPFVIGVSNPRHRELIERAADAGATAVSTEFFCLEVRSPILRRYLPVFSKLAGFNYLDFYRKYSIGQGYLRLNRNVKRMFVDEMEAAARARNMRFYVSDAHFKERCDNGSCCGLGPEWNYSRGQFCEAIVKCRQHGSVCWDDIAPNMAHLKTVAVQRSGINMGGSPRRYEFHSRTLFDYLHWLWNNPKAGQSPYKMFEGVMRPARLDKHGDVIYELDKARL